MAGGGEGERDDGADMSDGASERVSECVLWVCCKIACYNGGGKRERERESDERRARERQTWATEADRVRLGQINNGHKTRTLNFHLTFPYTNVSFPTWAGKRQKEGNKEEKADERATMRRKSRLRTAVTARTNM